MGYSLILVLLCDKKRNISIEMKMKFDSSEGKNPRKTANLISKIFFGWTIPIFKQTFGKTLHGSDVYEPLQEDLSNVLGDRLER